MTTLADTIDLAGSIPIRRIGFGAMRITGRGVWGMRSDPPAAIAFSAAVYLDVNFIDTADSYGPNVSEELIAAALNPYRAGLIIGTKGGMVRSGPWQWTIDGHPKHLRACVEASLERLRIETGRPTVIRTRRAHQAAVSRPFRSSPHKTRC